MRINIQNLYPSTTVSIYNIGRILYDEILLTPANNTT